MNSEQVLIRISIEKSIEIEHQKDLSKGCFDRLDMVFPYIKSFVSKFDIKKELKFIFHLGDCYSGHTNGNTVICFTKKKDSDAILIPNIDFFNLYLYTTLNECRNDINYYDKKDSSIFVGASTGDFKSNKRILFCKKCIDSKKNLGYIDNLCQGKESEWHNEYPFLDKILGQRISIEEQLKHKVVVNIDGNTLCWSRLYWQIQSNSIVVYIEKDNSSIQFFDHFDHSNCYIQSSLEKSIDVINSVFSYSQCEIDVIQKNCKNFSKCFDDYLKNPSNFLEKTLNSILCEIAK